METAAGDKRIGNKRGFGGNLREEVMDAMERLLSRAGSGSAVTLRAVAREAGIAAPSVYLHFTDRDAVLDAVIARGFERLTESCAAAAASAEPGRAEIEAICSAYLRFAEENPGRYRVLFERSAANIASPPHEYAEGLRAFDLLVRAFEHDPDRAGTHADSVLHAQSTILVLHGLATMRPALPGFPWLAGEQLLRNAIRAVP